MTERKITGATLVALPGLIQNKIREETHRSHSYYAVYLWLDDEKALYLHGNTAEGRSSGGFQGRFADQIGTQYFAGLESVLGGETLLEALKHVTLVQIDSKEYNWNGTFDELLDMIRL
jgi:hypothetical protein